MEIKSLEDIIKNLQNNRDHFLISSPPVNELSESISVLIECLTLISKVAKIEDDEHFILEVLVIAYRRVFASFSLLMSGFYQEAQMILRNAIELLLIAIDITYNKSSLDEWKKTYDEDLKVNFDEWYFKKSKICSRIELNKNSIYPDLERTAARFLCKEWENISNEALHAHSLAQIKGLIDEGRVQLTGVKSEYGKDLNIYARIILNIVSFILGIEKYENLLKKNFLPELKSFDQKHRALAQKIKNNSL